MSIPVFMHGPLPEDIPHIRLIELKQAGFNQDVVCELSTWPLDTSPPFLAVSYTWGVAASNVEITVNGKSMVVRQNSRYALQQAFHQSKGQQQYIWMDAICIDQENNRERSLQVALMGDLYKRASTVLACIGPHADDSEFLLAKSRKTRRLLKNISSVLEPDANGQGWSPPFVLDTYGWLGLRSLLSFTQSTRLRLTKAFIALLKRPYFRRVWILQELYMGKEILFACGPDTIPSDRLLALTQFLDPWHILPHRRSGLKSSKIFALGDMIMNASTAHGEKMRALYYKHLHSFQETTVRQGCLNLACTKGHNPLFLQDVLKFLSTFECGNILDKVYGILSLVDWPSDVKLTPDYDKNALELAAEILVILQKSDTRNYLRLQDCVRIVAGTLDLFSTHSLVEAAMKVSCLSTSEPELSPLKYGYLAKETENWVEYEIATSNTKSQHGPAVYIVEPTVDGKPITVIDERSQVFAHCPPETLAGDLYLRSHKSGLHYGLVVRRCETGLYVLVGISSDVNGSAAKDSHPPELNVWWDPRDAVLFYIFLSDWHQRPDLLAAFITISRLVIERKELV